MNTASYTKPFTIHTKEEVTHYVKRKRSYTIKRSKENTKKERI